METSCSDTSLCLVQPTEHSIQLSLHQLPSHFEYPEQSNAAQHRDADGRDDIQLYKQRLKDAATHHKAIKAVEQRHEVDLQAEGVHLHQHLQGEQQQQDLVGPFWGRNGKEAGWSKNKTKSSA